MRIPATRLTLLLFVGSVSAAAQTPPRAADTASRGDRDWLVGGSFGVPGYGGKVIPQLFTVGVQWTQLRRGRPGPDFSLGTMPRALAEGVLVLGFRGGAALSVPLSPGAVLLPSAGVSLVGGMGGGGGGGLAGLNAGIAAAFSGSDGGTGLRTGVTWHRFPDSRRALWLLEVGFARIPKRPS